MLLFTTNLTKLQLMEFFFLLFLFCFVFLNASVHSQYYQGKIWLVCTMSPEIFTCRSALVLTFVPMQKNFLASFNAHQGEIKFYYPRFYVNHWANLFSLLSCEAK